MGTTGRERVRERHRVATETARLEGFFREAIERGQAGT
jgi:hypothetical protein